MLLVMLARALEMYFNLDWIWITSLTSPILMLNLYVYKSNILKEKKIILKYYIF